MNGLDQFEEHLRRRPLRPIPADWREGILSAAHEAVKPSATPPATPRRLFSSFKSQIANLFWPSPKAWAALGAAWLLVVVFSLAAREPALPALARTVPPPSPQLRALLQEQERLLAELVGPVEKPAADRPKPTVFPPHSQRRERFSNHLT